MKMVFQWIVSSFLVLISLNLQALNYIIQDLGTLATDESHAIGINNQNSIVGFIKQAGNINDFIWKPNQGLIFLPYPSYQMFLVNNQNQGLVSLPFLSYQLPLINNHNQVVSIFWHETNYWFANNFRSKHVCIFHNDACIQDLGSPKQWKMQELEHWQTSAVWDNKELGVLAFNDHQQILISNSTQANKATQFAIWENGTFKDIDTDIISNAYGMNDQGWILGRKWVQKDGVNVPMLVLYNFMEGTIFEIIRDINIVKRQLNDLGQVIIYQVKESGFKGFLWDPKKGLIDLEDFAPFALNNCDQIIGFKISELQNKKLVPLMWTPSEIISLNQSIGLNNPESIWGEITSLNGINDNGYIIGQGLFDGKKHAFVLIPQ
jgi:hypothetical protein